jgi:hypothetical protein
MQCSTLPCCCNEKTNAAIDTAEAAAQGRGKACRNAVHQFGAPAERGVQHAGPSTRCTGDARADDHTRDVAFASRGRAGIDPGLIGRSSHALTQ